MSIFIKVISQPAMKMKKSADTKKSPSNGEQVSKNTTDLQQTSKSSVNKRTQFRKKKKLLAVSERNNIKNEPSNTLKNCDGEKPNLKKNTAQKQVKPKKARRIKHNKNIAGVKTGQVVDSKSASYSNPEKTVKQDVLEQKHDKIKRPQSIRQLHKHRKQAEKRKAMRENKIKLKKSGKVLKAQVAAEDDSGNGTESKVSSEKEKQEKIILPKSLVEATSNWRKLQMAMKEKAGTKNTKRKNLDPLQIRNPKYRKLDERAINERVITQVIQTKGCDKSSEIWFDDVDEIFLEKGQTDSIVTDGEEAKKNDKTTTDDDGELVKPEAYKGLTNIIGMDCEMVGVKDGNESILARVSLVNRYGEKIFDKFVKPTQKVTDYRTHISGIRPEDLKTGEPFKKVRSEVANLLKGRVLIGHALKNDFKVLKLRHPMEDTRDTSMFPPFREMFNGKSPGLRKLTEKVLSVKIQRGEHNSIQDAQAAVRLYTMYKTQWEAEVKKKGKKKKQKVIKTLDKTDHSDKLEVIDRLWNV